MTTILKERIVFEGKLTLEEAQIEAKGKQFSRLRVNREDAVAVLILNEQSGKVILTRQFRYAIMDKTEQSILEIVAGKVNEEEDPLETAIRETEEETGYRIKKENTRLLLSCFTTPGYSSERLFIYSTHVTNADKVSEGGGLQEENENIEVVEMELSEFIGQIRKGRFNDAKTYLAGMHLLLHKNQL
jgi:nudix-type nucleoside diphosphatase (YffH/AdpP family)